MNYLAVLNWKRLAIFNLLIVAFLGVLMRYKIAFEFPYFFQKNLQHAHSHFAFTGWISLLLMVMISESILPKVNSRVKNWIYLCFLLMAFSAYGMLIFFAAGGYSPGSIVFSTLSILITIVFSLIYWFQKTKIGHSADYKWFSAALVFNLLSAAGTFWLSYMMAAKIIDQHSYLASVYWYLHFQYNGWFFFAGIGLILQRIRYKGLMLKNENIIFWLFAGSCLPAYGLSVLWANLPLALYTIVAISALAQTVGYGLLAINLFAPSVSGKINPAAIVKALFIFSFLALGVKFLLQLGSTIPAISKLAFGFRPIVIAYLHLVLLAFTSMQLITLCAYDQTFVLSRTAVAGIIILMSGVLLNEILLAIQGIASFSYTLIPNANEMLLAASIVLLSGIILINLAKWNKS